MKNAVVLIDEWNTSRAAVQSGHLMDYNLLKATLDEVLSSDFECDHIEFIIYVGMPPVREDYADANKSKTGFTNMLESNGFLVKTRLGMPTGGAAFKANVDTMMCVDACTTLSGADLFLFVTGDGDFSYLVRHIREQLKPAGVASLSIAMSNDLKNACSFYIELDDIVKSMMPPLKETVDNGSDLV